MIVGQMDKWFRVWCTCHSLLISCNMASAAAASFGPNVKVLELNAQMKAVMTIIRSQECSADQFRFYADRIVRFVVESGLAEVPCESNTHTHTHTHVPCTQPPLSSLCVLGVANTCCPGFQHAHMLVLVAQARARLHVASHVGHCS